jgi:hypothetical protein
LLLSESDLLCDWRFTANQFVLATSPLRLTTNNFFSKLNPCGHSPYVTSSLTRRWVCRLQLLLVLASTVILGSMFRVTHDHILLSLIRDSHNLEVHVPVIISPKNRVAQLYPQQLGPFSSPSSTCRAMVEVSEPASAREEFTLLKFLLALYRIDILPGPYRVLAPVVLRFQWLLPLSASQ